MRAGRAPGRQVSLVALAASARARAAGDVGGAAGPLRCARPLCSHPPDPGAPCRGLCACGQTPARRGCGALCVAVGTRSAQSTEASSQPAAAPEAVGVGGSPDSRRRRTLSAGRRVKGRARAGRE